MVKGFRKRILSLMTAFSLLLVCFSESEVLFNSIFNEISVKASNENNTSITIWDGTYDTSWYKNNYTEFNIYTAEQLAGLRKLVNSGEKMSGKTFKLCSDIYLNDPENYTDWINNPPSKTWLGIGTSNMPFQGTFLGQNHTIYGLYSYTSGLFYKLEYASVKSLDISHSFLKASNDIGFISNYVQGGVILDCHLSGYINGSCGSLINVGGICGKLTRGQLSLVESNCDITIDGPCNAGGLCGFAMPEHGFDYKGSERQGPYTKTYPFTIGSCINYGTISVKGENSAAGGIVGYVELYVPYDVENRIVSCENKGDISADNAGGIVGYYIFPRVYVDYNEGVKNINIFLCSNHSKISGKVAGGLLGFSSPINTDTVPLVNQSYNIGKVAGTEYKAYIIGSGAGVVKNCFYLRSADDVTETKKYYLSPTYTDRYGTEIKENQLLSGEVTYRLNIDSSYPKYWSQYIGDEMYPVINRSYSKYAYVYCDDSVSPKIYYNLKPNVEKIELAYDELTLIKGSETIIDIDFTPQDSAENEGIEWISSNLKAVTVSSSGKVQAIEPGTSVITARIGKISDSFEVTVIENALIELSSNTLLLLKGSEKKIDAVLTPQNAVNQDEIEWLSSNPETVSVDSMGVVKANAAGTAVITANIGEVSSSCEITVFEIASNIEENDETDEINEITSSIIGDIINGDEPDFSNTDISEEKMEDIKQEIKEAVENGDTFHTDIKIIEQTFDSCKTNWGQIQKAAKDLNAQFAGAYNIDVELYHKDNDDVDHHLANITELENEITFTVDLPTGNSGKNKRYVLVRIHKNQDGETEYTPLDVTINSDGTFSARSNKYSEFILVAIDVDEEENQYLESAALVLEGVLKVKMLFSKEITKEDGFTVNGKEIVTTDMIAEYSAPAKDFCEDIIVKRGNEVVKIFSISKMINKYKEIDSTKDIVTAIEKYCTAAREYFKEDGTVEEIEAEPDSAFNFVLSEDSLSGIQYCGTSLLLKEDTTLRHYFIVSGDINDYSFKVGDEILVPLQKEFTNYYYIEISNISADRLGDMKTLEVSDGTNKLSLSCSALSYCNKVLGSDSESNQNLKNLCAVIYYYYRAAVLYKG